MLRSEDWAVLAGSPLFYTVAEREIKGLLREESLPVVDFAAGETIYDVRRFSHSLGILLAGQARVLKVRRQGKPLPMGILRAGDVFGMAAVFYHRDTYARSIRALEDCRILFLSEAVLERIFRCKPALALAYIHLLSRRIDDLNRKIDAFTGHDSRRRLAAYLWENADPHGGALVLSCSVKSLGEQLDMGRASLYRAFAALEAEGLIHKEGKRIVIPDLNLLK